MLPYFPPWILLCAVFVSFICFRVSGTRFGGCDGQWCGTMYFSEHQCRFTCLKQCVCESGSEHFYLWNWSTEYLAYIRCWLYFKTSECGWALSSVKHVGVRSLDLCFGSHSFSKTLRQDSRLSNKFSYANADSVRLPTCWDPNNAAYELIAHRNEYLQSFHNLVEIFCSNSCEVLPVALLVFVAKWHCQVIYCWWHCGHVPSIMEIERCCCCLRMAEQKRHTNHLWNPRNHGKTNNDITTYQQHHRITTVSPVSPVKLQHYISWSRERETEVAHGTPTLSCLVCFFLFSLSGRFGRCWSLEQFREPEPAAKWDWFSLPGDVLDV